MTVKDLVHDLLQYPLNYEVYIHDPDQENEFFVDKILHKEGKTQLFIQTAE